MFDDILGAKDGSEKGMHGGGGGGGWLNDGVRKAMAL